MKNGGLYIMKKFSITLLFILFLSVHSFTQDKIAVVLKIKGPVTIQKVKKSKKIPAKTGMVLHDGDKIITGEKGFAAVRYLDDKSLIRIRQNSVCTIEGKKHKEKIDKSIWVEIGTFFASIFKPKGSFKVITPTSVASIKGTKFWIIHDPDKGTIYVGIEGIVEVSNEKGKALMKKGESCIVTSKDEAPIVRETQKGDLPEDAEEVMGQTLEIEFKNDQGSTKKLKIDLESQK